MSPARTTLAHSEENPPSFLLIGPYDPTCGEYTFVAPPLGVWRLVGFLRARGIVAEVFDPNCCDGSVEAAFDTVLAQRDWSVIGVSTTGMTLCHDLELAHQARRRRPRAVLIAGGMEATFAPDQMFRLGPFDLVALGEGEGPLLDLHQRLSTDAPLTEIAGTAWLDSAGNVARRPRPQLAREALRDAIFTTPYADMPYAAYWERLEKSYRVGHLPMKAEREARLAEIRSVRLNTLNYCPMACTFCSSTNFLHAAQDAPAKVARLDAAECLEMLHRVVAAQPNVRTVIFQDDIFVFTQDKRVLELCAGIVAAKRAGTLPSNLEFISTNRIDAMTPERLAAMRDAGFRVLGFGVESFAPDVLVEFNKGRIQPHIEPMLSEALAQGITPFLDLILTSPRSSMASFAETIRKAYQWLLAGCEMGAYPYVVPFSGARMATDPELVPHTVYTRKRVARTAIEWDQPSKILPIDPGLREVILRIEADYEKRLDSLQREVAHLPSRIRSLLWVLCSVPVLARLGHDMPAEHEVRSQLYQRLPLANEIDMTDLIGPAEIGA